MEEIIKESGLSKGGVYHYFKNKYEIIFEIFKRGCEYRKTYIINNIKELEINTIEVEFLAKMIIEKILRVDDDMTLYAIFLTQIPFDKNLNKIYDDLLNTSKKDMTDIFPTDSTNFMKSEQFTFISNTINAYIISAHLLGEYKNINNFKNTLKEMIITAINTFKKECQTS